MAGGAADGGVCACCRGATGTCVEAGLARGGTAVSDVWAVWDAGSAARCFQIPQT